MTEIMGYITQMRDEMLVLDGAFFPATAGMMRNLKRHYQPGQYVLVELEYNRVKAVVSKSAPEVRDLPYHVV